MKKVLATQRYALTVIARPDAFRIKFERPQRRKLSDNEDFMLMLTPVVVTLPAVGMFVLMILKG